MSSRNSLYFRSYREIYSTLFSVRQLYPPGHPGHLLFEPMDSRIPRVLISIDSLKDGQLDLIVNSLQAKTLFEVEIKEWEEGSHYISGELIQEILTHFFT